ncbi:MAG: TolC family protein [Hylemonella sp.]|nr:TolC family protein [Hylemonella sp.]
MNKLSIFLALQGLCLLATAQPQPPTDPLQALLPPAHQVQDVVLRSPATRAALAQRDGQLRRADITESGPAEFTARLSQQNRHVSDPSERYSETLLSLERPVRWWGKAGLDADQAGASRSSARLAYADAIHETSRELLQLWVEALRAGMRLDNAQTNLTLAQELDRLAAARLRLGEISQLDASLAQAELQRAQAALDQARGAQSAAAARLTRTYPGITLAQPALPEPAWLQTRLEALPAMPELRQQYLERNHQLNLWRSEAARLRLLAQRADRDQWPDPTLGIYTANERAGAERIIGVSISVPISGKVRQNHALAAAADAQNAEDRVQQLEQSLGADIEARYNSLQHLARAAISVDTAALTQQLAAEKSRKAYTLGEHTMTELIQNRRLAAEQLTSARLAQLEVLEGLALIELDLHRIWDFDE